MTKAHLLLVGAVLALTTFISALASVFTMNPVQSELPYETDKSPVADPGTGLVLVTPLANGADYWGTLNIGENDRSGIQIGANRFGQPSRGYESDGDGLWTPSLGNPEGNSMTCQYFRNADKFTRHSSLVAGIGYDRKKETCYYLQNQGATIGPGGSARISLAFSNAGLLSWNPETGERVYLGWGNDMDPGLDWSRVSGIGFNFAADIPAEGGGRISRVRVIPTPEPISLISVGLGLVGLALLARKLRSSSRKN